MKNNRSLYPLRTRRKLPISLEGVVRAKKIEKIGMWSSDTAQLWFEDVRVPKKYIIGEEGSGFIYQMIQFQQERIFAMASAISGLENCINETINYTRERQAFGKSVLDNQYIHFQLAELQVKDNIIHYSYILIFVISRGILLMRST